MTVPVVGNGQTGRFKYNLRFLIIAAIALVIAAVHFTLSHYSLNRNFPLATFQDLIDGTAYKPFQFRILVPWLVAALNSLTGVAVATLYRVIETVSVVALVFSSRYFLRSYLGPPVVDIFAFGVVLLLPFNYLLPREIALVIPADIPAIMFFTLLLALMVREKWRWYYVVFAIATLNRETTCFISLIFLLAYWKKLPARGLLIHLGAQLVVWAAIKTWLAIIYADNPGAQFEFFHVGSGQSHFETNIEFLTSPERVLTLLSSFGFLWIPIIIWKRLIQDQFIKRALLGLIPFFVTMLVIGNLNETRIFGEWIPLVYVANLIIIRELYLKYELRKADKEQTTLS